MTIRANIEAKILEIEAELITHPQGDGPKAKAVRDGAIAAILGGSEDWVAYMDIFAETPEELARLVPSDGTHADPSKREARAYLVANGVCAPGTTRGMLNKVEDRLD